MNTLDEICNKYGTDKGTGHPHPHGYAPHYEKFFAPLRHDKLKVLEIGVGSGESIRTWLEYFHQASIFGLDNNAGTNEWNTVGAKTHPRYNFVHGDQGDDTMWKCFVADYGMDWDIIIDDGSHMNHHVIGTYRAMWPYLRQGGLYAIEDLGVCFGAGSVFLTAGTPSHDDFIRSLSTDALKGKSGGIDFVYATEELAIIRKVQNGG